MKLERIIEILLNDPKVKEMLSETRSIARTTNFPKEKWKDIQPELLRQALEISEAAKREIAQQLWQDIVDAHDRKGVSA
jgi:pantoate kinase